MKLISWNVNGIRAVLKKDFMAFVNSEDPDILSIQETKAQETDVQLNLEGYIQYWNSAEKNGYSGTLVFTKVKPISFEKGLGIKEHDNEGRVLTLEFDDFFLINVYTPNSKRGLLRLDYRQIWDREFLNHLKHLEKSKPVICCGDLNVAHQEIDLKNPKSNRRNAGFTDEERAGFQAFIDKGFVDVFRALYPDRVQYTWWSYMFNARAKGIGWRIDYFVVSKILMDKVKDMIILDDVMGSDHCPVKLILD